MKYNNNSRRSRGRSNNNGNRNKGPNRAQVFDSNGPEVRIRGTAQQVAEKYETLARDALSSGDHVLAQNYLQHAEHYQRVVNSYAVADARAAQLREEELSLPESIIPPANAPQEIEDTELELETA